MTQLSPLQPIKDSAIDDIVARECLPVLKAALSDVSDFHRLRVTDLPISVIHRLCIALDDERWVVKALCNTQPKHPYEASATKIIELRNTEQKPLLVFLPTGLRTAAEDSLDIATFQQIKLNDVAGRLIVNLLEQLPRPLSDSVSEMLKLLKERRVIQDEDTIVRYLLTVIENGSTLNSAGGAIFSLGLIPHFSLFEKPDQIIQWLTRNEKVVSNLNDLRRPLQERISQLHLQSGSIQSRLFIYLRDRLVGIENNWLSAIALEEKWCDLSFQRWPFEDSGLSDEVRIALDPLPLPRQAPDQFGDSVSLPVWDLNSTSKAKISFRSIPPPKDVVAWQTYRIQILAPADDVPTLLWESNDFPKPKQRAKSSRTIKAADLKDVLEEGTYFIRVEAYGSDGAILTKHVGVDPSQPEGRRENESENFLIVYGGAVLDPLEGPRAIFENSLMSCYFALQSKTIGSKSKAKLDMPQHEQLHGQWDTPRDAAARTEVHFELLTTNAAGYTVRIPGLLRKIEAEILSNPHILDGYYLDFRGVTTPADITIAPHEVHKSHTGFEDFLAARATVFHAIEVQHQQRLPDSSPELTSSIVETCDLLAVETEIFDYAKTYIQLCETVLEEPDNRERASRVDALSRIDSFEMRWQSNKNNPGKGLLIGPTHPLRLLWHLQHSRYRQSIIDNIQNSLQATSDPVQLLRTIESNILPINMPLVIFDQRGRPFIEQDLLTPFWSLFLPTGNSVSRFDTSFIRMQVRNFLGIRRNASRLGEVSPKVLANRIFDYIARHPYVKQLKINVFNPGDGERIAQLLREVESLRQGLPKTASSEYPELNYAVHLITSPEQLNQSGDALDAMLDPERHVAEDDQFIIGSGNYLQPKLLISRSTQQDFLLSPGDFNSHVTILLEQFSVDGRLGDVSRFSRGSFVTGLVHETDTQLETSSGSYGWIRGVNVEAPASEDPSQKLLLEAFKTAQLLQATVAGSQDGSNGPVVALRLDSIDRGLIRIIHDVSDQVLIVDRNLGLDYFDSSNSSSESGYLLDFSPGFVRGDSERLLVTTRCTEEMTALIQPAMQMAQVELSTGAEKEVLELLRSISGRLALRLFSGQNAIREVVGLLFSRLLLEHSELLTDRVIIPLDAHQTWFSKTDEQTTRSRADILVVALDPVSRTIDCTVVEVKLRSSLPSSDRQQLYSDMREQAENSIRHIQRQFDPDFLSRPRADFFLRCKELFSLLNFYVSRSLRYGLLSTDKASEIQPFISSLENGYHLSFRTRGILYSLETSGLHLDDDEIGFPVHRFGPDIAARLIQPLNQKANSSLSEDEIEEAERRSRDNSIALSQQSLSDGEVDSLRSFFDAHKLDKSAAQPEADKVQPSVTNTSVYGQTPSEDSFESQTDKSVDGHATLLPQPLDQNLQPENLIAEDDSCSFKAEDSQETYPAVQPVSADILLGSTEITPQYGLIGRFSDARVAVDLTGSNTISLFGVQGFGKSYTLGVIAEMGVQAMTGINAISSPLATVFFHYHKSDTYEPEFLAAINPNNKQREVDKLSDEYKAQPAGLNDVLLLVPGGKLDQRRREYPGIEVQPIKFSSSELGADSWKFLLGAFGNDSFYVRQLISIMRRYRDRLTLDVLRQEIADADLTSAVRRLAEDRIALAAPYIDDNANMRSLLRPGRTIIVDLRDEWLEKEDALGLFVVIMKTFSQSQWKGENFNKTMVFDEAHKYMAESELINQVVEIIREMRHQATSVVIASQDPLSVPRSVIELTSLLVLHRMTSPQWLKHLKAAISSLGNLTEHQLASLLPGEALVWAQRSTELRFTTKPQKIHIRPRVTRHGGGTKTAVEGRTIR